MTETTNEGVFGLTGFEQVRAFLYVLVPAVIVALDVAHANEIIGLVLAILAPGLSAILTKSGFRTWLYGLLSAVSALALVLELVTQVQITTWLPVVTTVIGGAVAAPRVAVATSR